MNADKRIQFVLLLSAFICVHLRFQSPVSAADPRFRAQTIDDKIQIGFGVTVADVDGDGKPDVLLADKTQFAWYRNPTWEKFVIAENLTKRDNVCLAAQDIDGDGKCELAVGADWDPNDREHSGAVFYMIAPADRTKKWEAVPLPAEPTVHRMRWVQLADDKWALVVVPLHGRGADAKGDGPGAKILLYHPPAGDPHTPWTTELFDDKLHVVHGLEVSGKWTIHLASREGVMIAQNSDGRGWFKQLTPRDDTHPSSEVCEGVLRPGEAGVSDQLMMATIEPFHGNLLAVGVTEPKTLTFARHVLTDKLVEGHALGWVWRYAKTGPHPSDALAVGWRGRGAGTSRGVAIWTPLDPRAREWRETVIDDAMACENLCIADLDGDQKADIIASGRATHNVKIYWNETDGEPPKR